jgi:hypothetical protein
MGYLCFNLHVGKRGVLLLRHSLLQALSKMKRMEAPLAMKKRRVREVVLCKLQMRQLQQILVRPPPTSRQLLITITKRRRVAAAAKMREELPLPLQKKVMRIQQVC